MAFQKSLFLLLIVLVVVLPGVVSQQEVRILISETGKVTSYYDEYFIAQSDGTITIMNPQNTSLFNIDFQFRLPGLQIREINGTGRALLYQDRLTIYSMNPNENLSVHYRITGITAESFRRDQGILKTAIESGREAKIYSNLMGKLQKSEIESVSTGSPGRLISFEVTNPTGYRFKIENAQVIKTWEMDPNKHLRVWNFPDDHREMVVLGSEVFNQTIVIDDKEYLRPFERWVVDFFDDNVTEGEIYWLVTDIYMNDILFIDASNISFYTQDDLFVIADNMTNVSENRTWDISFLDDRIFLRKFVSDRQMSFGKVIDITLMINNLDSLPIFPDLTDSVPSGFGIYIGESGAVVTGNDLDWDRVEVGSRSARRITYQIVYQDNDTIGLDYFMPAVLSWQNQVVYSQAIPFVRKYIPEKKLFVQKRVRFINDRNIEVTIAVQNLGEVGLSELVLKEFLSADNEFKEVSQQFESKGVWKIPTIEQGATWETKYVTDKTNVLNLLPEVYGVPTNAVMKTIIMSHSVSSTMSFVNRRLIEMIGIIALILVGVYMVFPPKRISMRRKRDVRKIAVIEEEIANLLHKTGTPKEEIERNHEELIARHSDVPKDSHAGDAMSQGEQGKGNKGARDDFLRDIERNKELLEKMKNSMGKD